MTWQARGSKMLPMMIAAMVAHLVGATDAVGNADGRDGKLTLDHEVSPRWGQDQKGPLRLVDADRVGVMGWSYGGFISAYLSATSTAFKAASVGAGISDWRTHYAWEPASYTTREYSFGATPWEDPNAYAVASPITYINNASTPTLIQHVDGDPIVTVLNAHELQHALQDRGVENRLVIYPGRGHGIRDLRQRLGALWHNWQWFLKYLWDETMELPVD